MAFAAFDIMAKRDHFSMKHSPPSPREHLGQKCWQCALIWPILRQESFSCRPWVSHIYLRDLAVRVGHMYQMYTVYLWHILLLLLRSNSIIIMISMIISYCDDYYFCTYVHTQHKYIQFILDAGKCHTYFGSEMDFGVSKISETDPSAET